MNEIKHYGFPYLFVVSHQPTTVAFSIIGTEDINKNIKHPRYMMSHEDFDSFIQDWIINVNSCPDTCIHSHDDIVAPSLDHKIYGEHSFTFYSAIKSTYDGYERISIDDTRHVFWHNNNETPKQKLKHLPIAINFPTMKQPYIVGYNPEYED